MPKAGASQCLEATGKKGEQLSSISVIDRNILLDKELWTDDYCYFMGKC